MEPIKRGRRPAETQTSNVESVPVQSQPDNILEMLKNIQSRLDNAEGELLKTREENQTLKKQVSEARGDKSEAIKESKRYYGYEIGNTKRRLSEHFNVKYRTIFVGTEEKAVTNTKTVGAIITTRNEVTGKWVDQHNIEVTFHDGTTEIMNNTDFIKQYNTVEIAVPDKDIEEVNGVNMYTLRTDKYGTFTVPVTCLN